MSKGMSCEAWVVAIGEGVWDCDYDFGGWSGKRIGVRDVALKIKGGKVFLELMFSSLTFRADS